jgi:hypothetical protein
MLAYEEAPMRFVYPLAAWLVTARWRGASLLLCATLLAIAGCASSAQIGQRTSILPPTPVVDGPLASVVRPVVGTQPQRISTSYDASTQQAKITLTIGAAPTVEAAQAIVMTLCFQVQKALWASNPSLREVKVIVLGPIRDDYANIIDDAYGVSDTLAPTAAKLQWSALSPDVAWSRYDNTWLRPTYSPNWLYGKNN